MYITTVNSRKICRKTNSLHKTALLQTVLQKRCFYVAKEKRVRRGAPSHVMYLVAHENVGLDVFGFDT